MADYTIDYSHERVLPQGLVGKAWAGRTVYESSCIVKGSDGKELNYSEVDGKVVSCTRFSVRYTQEEADEAKLSLEDLRSAKAKAQLDVMLKIEERPTETHPEMKKSDAVDKADLEAKAMEIV